MKPLKTTIEVTGKPVIKKNFLVTEKNETFFKRLLQEDITNEFFKMVCSQGTEMKISIDGKELFAIPTSKTFTQDEIESKIRTIYRKFWTESILTPQDEDDIEELLRALKGIHVMSC